MGVDPTKFGRKSTPLLVRVRSVLVPKCLATDVSGNPIRLTWAGKSPAAAAVC